MDNLKAWGKSGKIHFFGENSRMVKGEHILIKKIVFLTAILFLCLSGLNKAFANETAENLQGDPIYSLNIDRFNNGDSDNDFKVNANDPKAYHGGDFKGVELQLDYIKDMGFTAILLSPIFDNEENGYHGYWTKDFYKPEEHFGTMADFKHLVKEAHKRKMKVFIEFPANAVGPNHPWLEDAGKQSWFKENHAGDGNVWLTGVPQLNLDNLEVQAYLIDAAKWWAKETKIDGYKLEQDTPANFSVQFSKALKKENPNLIVLGDFTSGNPAIATFDSSLDYRANEVLRKAFAKSDQPTDKLFKILENNQKRFQDPNSLALFMDHQMIPRFTHEAVVNNLHPGSRWKLALTYLYTTPGVPIVYYGTEIALEGGKGDDNLKQMDFRTDKELVDYISKLGEVRKQFHSLKKGGFEPLYNKNGMIVFKREFEGEVTVTAINNTSKSQSVSISSDKLAGDMELRGLLSDDLVKEKGGKYELIIDRDEAEIYVLKEKSGLNISYISAMVGVYLVFAGFLFLLIKRRRRKAN
jgi:glycosidase